jgi:serine/alanine adding enzyme
MIRPLSSTEIPRIAVEVHPLHRIPARLAALTRFALDQKPNALSRHPGWLQVLHEGLDHEVYAIEATIGEQTCGYLPLAFVSSMLFGRFLVSLPYLNSNGVIALSPEVETRLIQRAVTLAEELNVRNLELRHEAPIEHPLLPGKLTSKVHMRLKLPATVEALWKSYDPKVRNQIRKGEKHDFKIHWGGIELLDSFYAVLSENMRDLGTPIFSRKLFESILTTFPGAAEICLIRSGEQPIATALLLHGNGITEVPTASSLKDFNATCCNMLMYRHLIDRAVERGQKIFDFGRSTEDGNTFRFKRQWGAEAYPATWQYHVREGSVGETRPDNPRYQRLIRMWQRLPVPVTQIIGPPIVRGIP